MRWQRVAVLCRRLLPLALLAACSQLPPAPALSAPSAAAPPLAAQGAAGLVSPAQQPEPASARTQQAGTSFQRRGVAAAHPLAAQAGLEILRAGGSAVDAAVAVQMVLTLVEPQSSGIGGGAFLLHWDGQAVQAWDGRETAPSAATERIFLDATGRPLPYAQAVFGGRAVGTPGAVRMLEAAHRQHGRLPWARLFEPAITLAEQGFPLGPRLHTLLQGDTLLRRDAQARALFYRDDGSPQPVGTRLRNPALAAVLRALATGGADALHTGPIAQDIVGRVQRSNNPGTLSLADMAGYKPVLRRPLCTDWLEHYRVCGMPPPSSGHLALMQMLGMLQALPGAMARPVALQAMPGPGDAPAPEWLHLYLESARLAYADRALYVADPDTTPPPAGDWASLLAPDYLRQRAALVSAARMPVAPAGTPGGQRSAWAPMPDQPEHGTSHVSIVDGQGHALALTTSIEAGFGARLMSDGGTGLPGGFLLNNQLTDFSFAPADAQGRPVANRVQPGKRPRSTMSPTLVFDRRASGTASLVMSVGSPGGPFIPHFVARTLLASLAWGLDLQRAIDLPGFGHLGGPALLEAGRFPPATVQALRGLGHTVVETDLTSGLQGLQRTPTGWAGAADPRREGSVAAD
jgi:gamma-glutamyltranspeptidase/glutathione hydrolase